VPRIIAVVDWKSTQHYTGRNPPWIKLQSSYLDDPRVQSISSCDFGAFCKISLVASRCDNRIVFDPRLFRRRYGVSPISIRNLERAGLITITDGDDVHAQLSHSNEQAGVIPPMAEASTTKVVPAHDQGSPSKSPIGDRSSADRSATGDRSKPDRNPIGTQSNTDRASIDDRKELPLSSNQADSQKSASASLAAREHLACSEADQKDQSRERASKQMPARPPEIYGDGDADEERQIRTALKALGVVIHKCDTHPKRWIAEGITLDRLTDAVKFIRQYRAKPEPMPIFAAYLDDVVHDETAVDPIAAILAARPEATDADIWAHVQEILRTAHKAKEEPPTRGHIAATIGVTPERLRAVLEQQASKSPPTGASKS
jgi:hypothetical protein